MGERPTSGAEVARLRREAERLGSGQPLAELSLFVVGVRFENKRRRGQPTGNRQSEILLCEPGEPVELRAEPKNPADANAIAVYSQRGVQMGYIAADRTAVIRQAEAAGRVPVAIFQELVPGGAAIRVAFDAMPTLPPPTPRKPIGRAVAGADPDAGFWPDDLPPDD